MKGLLLIERAVLESLMESGKSIKGLANDLGVRERYIKNIVRYFLGEELINYDGEVYSVDKTKKMKEKMLNVNESKNIKKEIMDSIDLTKDSSVSNTQAKLVFSKLHLDSFEEKILEVQVKNFLDFIKGVKMKERQNIHKKMRLKEKRVLIFGTMNYGDIISGSLK